MFCYKCGCVLSEKDFCTGCGADVGLYKKIMYTANRFYNDGLDKAQVRDLSGSVASLRQCLKLNKNHIEARNLLGLVYFERGDVVAALSEWIMSKNIRSEKNIADDYIEMLQNNPARFDTYKQTIKKYNMALVYCQQDSLDLAVIQLKKVVSMNPKYVQARQLLALLYINTQEWERAKKELERALRIDMNNTITLRYLKEVDEMMPTDEERIKKRREAVVYQSGNDTVIQPVGKKEAAGLQTIFNIIIGIVLGVGIAWFLVLPSQIQKVTSESNDKYREVSEQLDAKTVEVNELTTQISELTAEKTDLTNSLNAAQEANAAIEANTDLIEAALMYMNDTQDELVIADALELIDKTYMENEATESFRNLYDAIKTGIGPVVAKESYNVGYDAFRTEDYDTAVTNLSRAYEYNPKNGEALYNLGNAYNKKGETEKAAEIYEQVIELFPNTEKARKSETYIREIRGETE
ncbi:tetratricopeptide repeat protein [Lachnospiraceae bacterium MD335]|nr:tetratricopeptide repeat protein [Lachnospiraceae bacterium MD335]